MENTCYKGQEQHFYGREGKGPGAYLNQDFRLTSLVKSPSNFSVPKSDRGLLKFNTRKLSLPGPAQYNGDT